MEGPETPLDHSSTASVSGQHILAMEVKIHKPKAKGGNEIISILKVKGTKYWKELL